MVGNETTIKDSGTYSAKVTWGTTGAYAAAFHAIADSTVNYVQFRLYVDSYTSTAASFAQMHVLRQGAWKGVRLDLDYVSPSTYKTRLKIDYEGSSVSVVGSTVLNTGQWYTIEVFYKNHATEGGGQWWINSVSEGSDFTRDTEYASNNN